MFISKIQYFLCIEVEIICYDFSKISTVLFTMRVVVKRSVEMIMNLNIKSKIVKITHISQYGNAQKTSLIPPTYREVSI